MDLIYSVKDIFSSFLAKNGVSFYNIPEYQRGYKWQESTVKTLLNDIASFNPNEDEDTFYCLQNITLCKVNEDGKQFYNVIDGQQRLTTLFIILAYLNKDNPESNWIDNEILRYSVRSKTHEILKNSVSTGKIWKDYTIIDPLKSPTRDGFYILSVCEAVRHWFNENKERFSLEHFLNRVKIIVNIVESGEEEHVFAGLNGGKVKLDGADLTRAILITRATKEKYSGEGLTEKISNFRVKLGMELDAMNLWWNNDSHKSFFELLLPNRIDSNKDFVYKKYPIDLLYLAFFEAYGSVFKATKDELLQIRHIEKGLDLNNHSGDDNLELYDAITDFHSTMLIWYEDNEIYNLLGYMMSNFKGDFTFTHIWLLWQNSMTKADFRKKLKDWIKYRIATLFTGTDFSRDTINIKDMEEGFSEFLEEIKKIENTDWYNRDLTIKILPLADLIPEIGSSKHNRMNFLDFKRNDEDKEHIRSQTREINKDNPTEEEKELLEKENREGLNSIGNIVLLDLSINRSYGNACLQDKIKRILWESNLKNRHIRPYTEKVFKSKISNLDENSTISDELFWSIADIRRTAEELHDRIKNYF